MTQSSTASSTTNSRLTAEEAVERLQTPAYQLALRQMPHQLILDMDDTLNVNGDLFSRSKADLNNTYRLLFGGAYTGEQFMAAHDRVEVEHLPIHGYTPKRWYLSAFAAAEAVIGRPTTIRERQLIRVAAHRALGPGELHPGVSEALTVARDAGVQMALLTKGDVAKQQFKIDHHRFAQWFQSTTIVPTKTENDFRAIATRHGFTSPVSIGDRYAADVVPAIACGYRGIVVGETNDVWDTASERDDAPSTSSFAAALALLAEEQMTS